MSATYLAVCGEVVGVAGLLAPGALDRVPVDVGVVHGDYGVRRGLLRRKPETNGIALLSIKSTKCDLFTIVSVRTLTVPIPSPEPKCLH